MANTIGQFSFECTLMDKDGAIPFSPYVHLCLAQKLGETRDGFPCISPKLMSEQEIDSHTALLKADLDAIAKSAKVRLKNAQDKTIKMVSQRKPEKP